MAESPDENVAAPGSEEVLSYSIRRPVYNNHTLSDARGVKADEEERSFSSIALSRMKSACQCSGDCVKKSALSFFPVVNTVRKYKLKANLLGDVVAGLTVGIMQIPQGMAYSLLAGLDPVYGLYTAFFPVLVYFIFGTSKHISPGSSPIICLMIGSTIDKLCGGGDTLSTASPLTTSSGLATNDTIVTESLVMNKHYSCEVSVATAVTLLTGFIQLGMGLLRLGFVTVYLSEPLTRGYTTGAAVHVFTSQIKNVFGLSVPRHSGILKVVYTYIDIFSDIASTNLGALGISAICIVILYVVKTYLNPRVKKVIKAPLPIDLVMVVTVTIVSYYMKFNEKYQINIVGDIPKGIPTPSFPSVSLLSDMVGDAFVLTIVSFAISMSMAQLFARKYKYSVDSNQELIAYGTSNIVGSSFFCYVMSVSLSRSLVQESAGGKTQVTGLVQSILIIIVILAAADLFYSLPNCVLSAIIIVALKGMFMQAKDIKKLWRSSKWDLSVWLITCLAVIFTDVDIGLVVGVGWSFISIVLRTQRPKHYLSRNVLDSEFYKNSNKFQTSKEDVISHTKVLCWEAPINYANAEYFVNEVYKTVDCHPEVIKKEMDKVKNERKALRKKLKDIETDSNDKDVSGQDFTSLRYIIIDCSSVSYLDTMGVTALKTIRDEYKDVGIMIYLADCNDTLLQILGAGKYLKDGEMADVFPSVHDAVLTCTANQQEKSEERSNENRLQNGHVKDEGVENPTFEHTSL